MNMMQEYLGRLRYLKCALDDGRAEILGEGRTERIRYISVDHSERWFGPEERVRAELWAELIYKYDYRPECIGVEVTIPGRTPNNYADLVIYTRPRQFQGEPMYCAAMGDVSVTDTHANVGVNDVIWTPDGRKEPRKRQT